VDEGAVLVGKWLGGVAFYAMLWLPTVVYPIVLAVHAPPAAVIDAGPIAAAYAGILLGGMALLALGVAASAATSNQIIAAVATFVVAMLLLLIGEVPEVAPGWLRDHATIAAALAQMDMRAHMDELARGLVSSAALVFHASLAIMGLWVATTLAVWGRRRRGELQGRIIATALVAVIAVCINVLGARHAVEWDVSAARVNSLDPRTERVLAAAGATALRDGEPVEILVVRAELELFAAIQAEVDRLLARLVAAQPALRVERIDPALEPGRIEALAAEFAIAIENLRDGGVVVFQHGRRRRAVDLLDMAGFAADDLGVGALAMFRAEEAFATALSEVIDADRATFCHTVGHGEMAMEAGAQPGAVADWTGLRARIEREGADLRAVDALAAGVPAACRVLIVAGPTNPLSAGEATAVARYLARGGRLLVALSESLAGSMADSPAGNLAGNSGREPGPPGQPDGQPGSHEAGQGHAGAGLDLVLAEHGVALPRAAVVDPEAAVAGPGQWFTTSGYSDHPITSSFQGRRLTMWLHPRAVLPVEQAGVRVSALIESSPSGWGERDLAALALGRAHRDPGDLEGPVAVAVAAEAPASGARLVVFGGAYALSSGMSGDTAGAGELVAAAALAWLSGHSHDIDIGAKTPEQVRLIMSQSQLTRTFVLCVVLLPALVALFGTAIWWRRRRA
jgi:ABC-2 type transport system permease protein